VDSFQFLRCKTVTVHNHEVLTWMAKRMAQAQAVGEKIDKVRLPCCEMMAPARAWHAAQNTFSFFSPLVFSVLQVVCRRKHSDGGDVCRVPCAVCRVPCAVCRVPCVCGGVAQVRVCHRCLYGREYNRKNEMQYLSWIKAESLYTSEGYKNFRSQPDKQKVIDDYAAGAPAAQANGVAVVGAGGAPAAAARAGAVPVVGQALLGELAGQYRKCAACQKILQKCQCEKGVLYHVGALESSRRGPRSP